MNQQILKQTKKKQQKMMVNNMADDKVIKLSKSNREIRGYAREKLLGNMLMPCLVTILYFSAKSSFNLIAQLGILGNDVFAFIFYIVLFLVLNSLWGLIKCSLTRFYLGFVTRTKKSAVEQMYVKRPSLNVTLGVSLILSVISLAVLSPSLIYTYFFAPDTLTGTAVSLVLVLAAELVLFIINSYLMPVYFIMSDFPDMGVAMVITMSLSIMNGKKFFKFIGLQLSFIPMYLLGFLSLGIGLVWVVPYVYTSYTYFYEDLCESFHKDSLVS